MGTHTKLCILFSWLGQVMWLFQHINKCVTLHHLHHHSFPATTTTHRHHTPLPPSPLPLPTHHVSARTCHTTPKRHQDDPADSSMTTRNEEGATRRKRDGHDGTHKGGQEGPKGHRKATGRAYKVRPPFFSFFFMSTDIPPPPSTSTPIPSSQPRRTHL